MPFTQTQSTILKAIEEELTVLRNFKENKENESHHLSDLIGSEKSKDLLNKTKNLQKIKDLEENDGIQVINSILKLFPNLKKQLATLRKSLNEIKATFEKSDDNGKKQLIKDNRNNEIITVYLRVLHNKNLISNLEKFKSLTDIIGQNEVLNYVQILQKKFSEQGSSGQISFIHLNNIFDKDTETELKRLNNKTTKVVKPQPISSSFTELKEQPPSVSVNMSTSSTSPLEETFTAPTSNLPTTDSGSISSSNVTNSKSKEKKLNVVDDLFKELTEKKTLIRELYSEITSLKTRLEQLSQPKSQETSTTTKGLEKILSTLNDRRNTEFDKQLLERENSIKELKLKLDKETELLQKQIDEKSELIASLENDKKTLTEKTESLKSDLEDNIELKKQYEQNNTELTNLQEKLLIQTEESNSKQEKLTSPQDQLSELQSNNSSNQLKIPELTKELNELKISNEADKKIIQALNKQKDEKTKELNQLQEQLESQEAFKTEIDSLKKSSKTDAETLSVLRDEKEKLNIDLNDAQAALENLQLDITKLNDELDKLRTNNSSNQETISKLTNQIEGLSEQLKAKNQEIKALTEQHQQKITSAQNALEESKIELTRLQNLLAQEGDKINKLEEKKYKDGQQLTSLNNSLKETIDNLDQAKKTLAESQKNANEFSDENKKLKKELETIEKSDSALQIKCDTLEKNIEEKNTQINVLTTKINETQQQLENNKEVENLNRKITKLENTIQSLEKQLQDKENRMPTEDAPLKTSSLPFDNFDFFHNQVNSSSPNFNLDSGVPHSTSPFSSTSSSPENDTSGFDEEQGSIKDRVPRSQRSQSATNLMAFSDDERDSLNSSIAEEELENPDLTHSAPNGNIPMPTQEQQDADALAQIKTGVINAFREENHAEIEQAFTKKFSEIATQAAEILFDGSIGTELSEFEDELRKISVVKIKNLVSELSNKSELLNRTIDKIHLDGLTTLTYLEEVKNSASFIFGTLKTGQKPFKDHITDVGRDLLINLCIENLQTSKRDKLLEDAKTLLKEKASDNNLEPADHAETIQKAAEELTKKILDDEDNLKNILEDAKASYVTNNMNLLEASEQKLLGQLQQKIDPTFGHYFPNVHLEPILEKINHDEDLSEDEIQKLPSELQYANSEEDFTSGLQAHYPHLHIDISRDKFEKIRSLLRIKALKVIIPTLPADENTMKLNAEEWLKEKLKIVTDKSISLKLDTKQQKKLDNEFHKLFSLTPLEDMAVTHKSVDELKEELKKLHGLKIKSTGKRFKAFSEIEIKLKEYPNLVDEYEVFKANLNNSLPLNFPIIDSNRRPNLNDTQLKVLLDKINHRLENDVSKWTLLNSNNIAKEITNDIFTDNANQFGTDKETIQTLVSNTLEILYKYHDLAETLNKREQWKTDIKSLYAFIQNLESFNGKIDIRVAKLENMSFLKKNDVNNNPGDVYLPHSCSIIPNTDIANKAQPRPPSPNFTIKSDGFYKQNALNVEETVTFEQTLSSNEKRTWSVTRTDDKCLAYATHKPWKDAGNNIKDRMNYETTYSKEVSFAQMIHAVNSFKEGSLCTLQFGKCSSDMEKKLRLFIAAYNELRNNKGPILVAASNPNLKMKREDIDAAKNEIKDKLNLYASELADTSKKLKDDTISHQIIRSRGC